MPAGRFNLLFFVDSILIGGGSIFSPAFLESRKKDKIQSLVPSLLGFPCLTEINKPRPDISLFAFREREKGSGTGILGSSNFQRSKRIKRNSTKRKRKVSNLLAEPGV